MALVFVPINDLHRLAADGMYRRADETIRARINRGRQVSWLAPWVVIGRARIDELIWMVASARSQP